MFFFLAYLATGMTAKYLHYKMDTAIKKDTNKAAEKKQL